MSIGIFSRRSIKLAVSLILVLVMSALLLPPGQVMAADELMTAGCVTIVADGKETAVRSFDGSYENNTYLSLSSLAVALKDTEKKFTVSYDQKSETFSITTGRASTASAQGAGSGAVWLTVNRWPLLMDGTPRRYYTVKYGTELFMSLTDIMLAFDICMSYVSEDRIEAFPGESFSPELGALDEENFFDSFSGILLGDATTGRVIYANNRYQPVPIASTTKLMTWLLLAEAVERGEKSLEDKALISKNAAKLSASGDAQVTLTENSSVPVKELVDCMMLASSNECALAVAEYVSGSESAFVELMNARAKELRLSSAKFYNCHGLPSYGKTTTVVKRQNAMSVGDMFKLSRYIVEKHPEIFDVTAQKMGTMETLKYQTYNSNSTMFNAEGVNGLKTGSTNRAGYCIVVSKPYECDGETHTAIAIVMGAETAQERGQAAEILLRCADRYFSDKS